MTRSDGVFWARWLTHTGPLNGQQAKGLLWQRFRQSFERGLGDKVIPHVTPDAERRTFDWNSWPDLPNIEFVVWQEDKADSRELEPSRAQQEFAADNDVEVVRPYWNFGGELTTLKIDVERTVRDFLYGF